MARKIRLATLWNPDLICKLGRKVMVVMVVMVSNGVMKNSSNGSNGSNHKLMDLKMDHVIMKQSIVVIG